MTIKNSKRIKNSMAGEVQPDPAPATESEQQPQATEPEQQPAEGDEADLQEQQEPAEGGGAAEAGAAEAAA